MKLGDIVQARPITLKTDVDSDERRYAPIPGRVVYIHPKKRFYVLAFQFGQNVIRESFFFLQEQENEIYENDRNHEREGRCRENRHHR